MPRFFYHSAMPLDQFYQFVKGSGAEAAAIGHPDRRPEPELRLSVAAKCMNVDWFARNTLVRKEKEANAAIAKYNRHGVDAPDGLGRNRRVAPPELTGYGIRVNKRLPT